MLIDRLYADVKKKGPVCLGLDTQYTFLPDCLKNGSGTESEKILQFNKAIIDATADVVGCYKVQIACYEALGLAGLRTYADTLAYIRSKGCVVIADVKRGDISSTAAQYAKGHFTGDFEADFITVNAYMGEDAISPYYEYLKNSDKGLFVLVKTSNPGGGELQDKLLQDGQSVYLQMARCVEKWGADFVGQCGFSSIGAVTGCTYPQQFAAIHEAMPHGFFLIPGYGAQGGTGKDVAEFFKNGVCGVVNASRSLLTAHKNTAQPDGSDFAQLTRQAALAMKEDIEQWL